ncbi:NAD(+) synthase [Halomicrobium sp. LC1Hm]|uniref:NAD(+) synthase n=1 Tax=Halomicrobium sp. LC1Hm TaxID=2610902 RepID=UPI0012985522|nr:NAD(+) synthase [Halomicrobium sp. LC1Hm]
MSDSKPSAHDPALARERSELATEPEAVQRLREQLPRFVERTLERAGAEGVVVALDGRVGSTVAAVLAIEAVGVDRVSGLVLPANMNDEASARAAEAVASMLSIEYERLQLRPLLSAFQRVIGAAGEPADDVVALDNARERFRMACLYYVANTTDRIVLGSVDRTRRLLGSVTKHGDDGVDLAPLAPLYYTEVRALARAVDVPSNILDRSTRTAGRADSDPEQLGVDPETLDEILHALVDQAQPPAAVAERLAVDRATVQRVRKWCETTRHKRRPPLTPSIDL